MIQPENAAERRVLEQALDIFIDQTRDLLGDPDYNQVTMEEDLVTAEKLSRELGGVL